MREKVVQDFKRDGATEKCLHDQKGVGSFFYIFLKVIWRSFFTGTKILKVGIFPLKQTNIQILQFCCGSVHSGSSAVLHGDGGGSALRLKEV